MVVGKGGKVGRSGVVDFCVVLSCVVDGVGDGNGLGLGFEVVVTELLWVVVLIVVVVAGFTVVVR